MFFLQQMLITIDSKQCLWVFFKRWGHHLFSLHDQGSLVFLCKTGKKMQSTDFIDVNKKANVNLVVSCYVCDCKR